MNIKNIILSTMLLSSSILASDCACFKLEGEFGKELKALIEKHQGQLPVVQMKKESSSSGLSTFFSSSKGVEMTQEQRLANGKRIYDNKCSFCHGQKAELAGSGTSQAPNSFSKDDLEYSIYKYATDEDHGGSMRMIMSQYVDTLSKDDIKSVSEYINSIK
jgi:cytochrome c553